MEIGKLNQRIDIFGHVKEVDSIGNHTNEKRTLFSVWSNVTMRNSITSSNEENVAGVTREVQQIIFRVRQSSQTKSITTTKHGVRFQGTDYDIKGIEPDFVAKDYLKIICEARK